jgi:hypothetical protein
MLGDVLMENVLNFLKSIRVYDFPRLTKVRIGNEHDGGYVAFNELCQVTETVYSVGVGNDVGFEKDWVARYPETEIHLFDPVIKDLPQADKRFYLHRFGLGLKWEPLKDVAQDSLLKMDIEWHEWPAILKFDEQELLKFTQLLIEFHIVHVEPRQGLTPYFQGFYQEVYDSINQDLFDMYLKVMGKLLNHFWIFHIHANNSLPVIRVNGFNFPPLLEISFVRKDIVVDGYLTKTRFPTAVDRPNKTDRPDILDFYPFWGV